MNPRIAVTIVALLGATGPGLADEPPMSRIFPYEVHVSELENGFRTIVVPMPSDGLVAYWSIVRTGSRDEYEPGRTGFAHFFEHMMFRGTKRFPAEVYNRITTELGADANAYTTDDLTAYHLGFAAEDLERVMELESDRFQRLDYPEPDFETEAGAVYGEYRKNRTNPFFSVYEAIHETAFDRHTYGHTTMGYERDIKNMPKMFDYSRSFFNRYYRPENVILLLAGDVDPAQVEDLARKYYGGWEPGYVAPTIPKEPQQTGERQVSVDYEGRSLPIVWIAYKAGAFDANDPVRVAGDLLAELAFGSTSEIYSSLVLERQLVEFVAADLGMNRDPGLFDIYTRIKDPARVDEVITEIDAAIERFRSAPPDPERLERLKSRLKYQFLMNLDTPDRVASSLARLVAITGGVESIDRYFATVEAVTAEHVQQAALAYLDPDRRTVAVLRGKN